ncbi:hypothetical protein HDU98_001007, partial [Podochytrium sp. JEL0797]
MVKGVVTIDGSNLIKGELNLKLPHYNRTQPLKVSLDPTSPYPLTQLHNFRTCVHLALSQIESIQAALLSNDDDDSRNQTREGSDNQQQEEDEEEELVEPTWIFNHLNAVSDVIQESIKALSHVDETKLFPIRESDGK